MLRNNTLNALISLFFPHCCAGCGNDLPISGQQVCLRCLALLPDTGFASVHNNSLEKLFYGRLPLKAASSQFYFSRSSIIQSIIHELKYKGNQDVGIEMGKLMGNTLKQSGRFGNIDAIVPLPLYPEKERIRGYNQAEVLGRGIQQIMEIPVLRDAVVRNRFTESQTHKNRMERWHNVEQVFSVARPELVQNKNILLTDDVITTGATLEACGNILINKGNCDIYLASLAFAMQ
jgi:ComF family protein